MGQSKWLAAKKNSVLSFMWEEKKFKFARNTRILLIRRATRRNLKKSRKSAARHSKTLEVLLGS
jgi:hypothetical protein